MPREKSPRQFHTGRSKSQSHTCVQIARIMRDDLVALVFFVHVTENSTRDAHISQMPKHAHLLPFHNAAATLPFPHDDASSVTLAHAAISQ